MEAQVPGWAGKRPDRRPDGIVERLDLSVHRRKALNLEKAPDSAAKRDDPLIVRRRAPIGSDDRLGGQIPTP